MNRITKSSIIDIIITKNATTDDDAYGLTVLLSKWITDLPDGWQLIGFDGFVTRDVSRLCHYHQDKSKYFIVGFPGNIQCNCEVPKAIMTLVKLECFNKGSRLVHDRSDKVSIVNNQI